VEKWREEIAGGMSAMVVPATSTFQLLFVTEFVERFNQFFDFFS